MRLGSKLQPRLLEFRARQERRASDHPRGGRFIYAPVDWSRYKAAKESNRRAQRDKDIAWVYAHEMRPKGLRLASQISTRTFACATGGMGTGHLSYATRKPL